jgi:hypothetical protein
VTKKKEETTISTNIVALNSDNVEALTPEWMNVIPANATMQEIQLFAQYAVKSGLFKGVADLAKAIVKIKAGQEMGMGVFEAMSSFDIIEGKVEINADASARAVKRSGKYDYTVKRLDHECCILEFWQRRDGEWVVIGESRFDITDMKRANLDRTADGKIKSTWVGYTRNMLFARAVTNGLAFYCPDATRVRQYAYGEIQMAKDAEKYFNDPNNIASIEANIAPDRSQASTDITNHIYSVTEFPRKWGEVVKGMYEDFTIDDNEYFKRVVSLFKNVDVDIIKHKEKSDAENNVGSKEAGQQGGEGVISASTTIG